LVVAIDFKQPQSYRAFAPTRELAAACGIAIDWRPFESQPLRPASPSSPGDDRGARHLRFRAQYLETDLQRYAAARGLVLRGLYRAPDSSLAGIGLLFAKQAAARAEDRAAAATADSTAAGVAAGARAAVDAYVARVFAGYWSEKLDIEDAEAIRSVLATAGADAAAFDPDALRGAYDDGLTELRQAGVIEAPAYLLGEELFIGRAHLPMIRWLIEGRTGPPPI
jgi:2-hydroxychromene-2-carboxylate isomerase